MKFVRAVAAPVNTADAEAVAVTWSVVLLLEVGEETEVVVPPVPTITLVVAVTTGTDEVLCTAVVVLSRQELSALAVP